MASLRPTAHEHDHSFPICSHFEYAELGYAPMTAEMLERSRRLSSLAGWPGEVTDASMDAVIAAYGVPYVAPGDPEFVPPTGLFLFLADGSTAVIAGGTIAGGITLGLPAGSATSVTFRGTSLAYDAGTGTLTGDLGGTDAIDAVIATDGVYDSGASSSTQIVFVSA